MLWEASVSDLCLIPHRIFAFALLPHDLRGTQDNTRKEHLKLELLCSRELTEIKSAAY